MAISLKMTNYNVQVDYPSYKLVSSLKMATHILKQCLEAEITWEITFDIMY
jgi:hypothetical protein